MKIFILAILLFCSGVCFSQNYSLNDVSKVIVKAFNDSDLSELKKISVTYEDYLTINQNYASEKTDSLDRINQRAYNNARGDRNYKEQMTGMKNTFGQNLKFFQNPYFGTGRIKFKSYEYEIAVSEHLFSKIASIRIICLRDTDFLFIEGIKCYKIKKGWKLAGVVERNMLHASPVKAESEYAKWLKKEARIKEENFPYKPARLLWDAIIAGNPLTADNPLLQTRAEFENHFFDFLSPFPPDFKIDLNEAYLGYINQVNKDLRLMHDSLINHLPPNFSIDQILLNPIIANTGNFRNYPYGINFRILFSLKIPPGDNSFQALYPGSPVIFVKGKKRNSYKLKYIPSCFLEDAIYSQNGGDPFMFDYNP